MCQNAQSHKTMKNSSKILGGVLPAITSGKENQSTINSPPCNINNLRSAFTKSARKKDNPFSTSELSESLGVNVDVGVGKRSLKDGDDLNADEEKELEAFMRHKRETAGERGAAMAKLVQIQSSLDLVREDQTTSLNNQEDMKGRLAKIEAMIQSASPLELEKLRKEKDNIQRQLVITTKRNFELQAKITAMEKRHKDLQDAYDRMKAGGKNRISRPSTAASNSTPCYPQRTQGSITRHVGKERAMLNYQQSVNDGSVKQAPAFGPGRRHPNGEIALSKKDPFKL